MGDMSTRTVAKAFSCTGNTNCVSKAEQYINEQPQKIFDSYTCQVTSVMNGSGGRSEYLQALLVLCSGSPKVFIDKK
ncbi:MAG TPA: hypothetical protein PLZ86_00495 [bacterium]|nr:hypothetical protein [bacterium]